MPPKIIPSPKRLLSSSSTTDQLSPNKRQTVSRTASSLRVEDSASPARERQSVTSPLPARERQSVTSPLHSFKLIDFHVYDRRVNDMEEEETEENDEDDEDEDSDEDNEEEDNMANDPRNMEEEEGEPKKKKYYKTAEFAIQMFGINAEGESASITITNYRPFFYVRVGDDWTSTKADSFIHERIGRNPRLSKDSNFVRKNIIRYRLEKHNRLYGFTAGKQDTFLCIEFRNMSSFNKIRRLWYQYIDGRSRMFPLTFLGTDTELYESGIPPLLRYFHIKDISPSGWIELDVRHPRVQTLYKSPHGRTTCTYEFVCPLECIRPLPEKEDAVPYKIMSFDIESSSSHGDMSQPVKTYKKLAQNIADMYMFRQSIFDKEKNKDAVKVKDTLNKLLRRVFLTAFGFDDFEDIALVYTKMPVRLEDIEALTTRLLELPLKDLVENISADKNDILSLFRKSVASSSSLATPYKKKKTFRAIDEGGGGTEGTEGEGEQEDGNGETEEEEEEEGAEEEQEEGDYDFDDDDNDNDDNDNHNNENNGMIDTTGLLTREQKKMTFADVLLSEKWSRDEKVQEMDKLLCMTFPPVKGDEVTFIGSTFLRYGEKEPYLNHCLVVGSCDAVPNAVIESCDTERQMLLKWRDMVEAENPDIVIGYNIFGFDYDFLFQRAKELNCVKSFLRMSRRRGELCCQPRFKPADPIKIEHSSILLATGEYDLNYVKMPGRLQIDLFMYFRREFTNFSSYKLDTMASTFVSDDIKQVVVVDVDGNGTGTGTGTGTTMETTTELYTSNLAGLHVGDFIHIEIVSFTSDYYGEGKKFVVQDIRLNQVCPVDNKSYNVIVIEGDHGSLRREKSVRWGMAKDDVTPQDIFRLTAESARGRAIVAKYCIQDCNLVHNLFQKVDVLTGYVEMSRICSVPISFLVLRGQGIKLTSYVAKKCRLKDTLMPDLQKPDVAEGYEGAIVLPPKCSMYMDNPVACVDYASLYPSSMISQNFSHDSKVWAKVYDLEGRLVSEWGERDEQTGAFVYDNLPGVEYIDIEFNTYVYVRKTPKAKAVKTKSGTKICRWAQFPDGKKGIMPSILEELLKARSDTRKKAKTISDPFMQNILDKRQLGYKVTANSLYGQCGARTSTFYEQDVAASTTATGRMMITYAKKIIENVYGNGRVYNTECKGPVLTNAEYVYGDSVASYTPVYILFQNKVRIVTIDSLAAEFGFGGWHVCEDPDTNSQPKEVCEMVPGVFSWSDQGWTRLYCVIRHALAPHKKMIRVLTGTGCVDVTDDHSLVRADGTEVSPRDVEVGDHLMHHTLLRLSEEAKETHTDGGEQQDHDIKSLLDGGDGINMLGAAVLVNRMYYEGATSVQIYTSDNYRPHPYFLLSATKENMASNNKIKTLCNIPYSGDVYDLTTANHHFAAGIGNMIVHNTDSVFFTFNLADPATKAPIRGPDALEITIEIAQDAAALCSRFLKPPMDLAYEKTLMPFVLLKKKRYVGMLYETNPKKGKLKYMGLALKRRDSCDYVKDVYGGILNILMFEQNFPKSIAYLNDRLEDLIQGRVPPEKLLLTKQLGSYYKNPQQQCHWVLSERIGKRDAGSKPKPGDRIKYLFFDNPTAKLQGDKIETPEYIREAKLSINYTHYITNQLMNPIQQLYGLGVEQIMEMQGRFKEIPKFRQEIAALQERFPDLEEYVEKKDKFCSARVKMLLFDPWLTKIHNQKHGIQQITSFFSSPPPILSSGQGSQTEKKKMITHSTIKSTPSQNKVVSTKTSSATSSSSKKQPTTTTTLKFIPFQMAKK